MALKPKQTTKHMLQTLVGKTGRFIARNSVPEILFIATLCLSRYMTNSDFSYPSEILLIIILLGVLVSAMFYAYKLVLRSSLAAHSAALLLGYSAYSYSYGFRELHRVADWLLPYGLTPFTNALLSMLVFAVIFGVLGYGIKRISNLKQLRTVPLLKFLVFVICFIFATQLVKVGARLWEIRQDLAYSQPTSKLQKPTDTKAAKPNVYYLLFDRYASDTTLKDLYGYDNSALSNGLKDQGFYLRENAYANYPFTMQSVSSTLSVDYHTELAKKFKNSSRGNQTGFAYRQALDHSPVTTAFQANGYQYNQISSWWDFTRINPTADTNPSKSFRLRILGKNFWLTDLQRDMVNKSFLSPLLLKGITVGDTTLIQYQLDRNPRQNFYAQMNALKSIAANSKTQQKPQFSFAHVLSPHDPYVFDANGNTPDYDNNRTDKGVDEHTKYINQLKYVNTQFTELISSIRTNDPSAVIIIQSDEGPYPKQFRGKLSNKYYYDPVNLPLDAQRQKFGIMAAYYLPDTDEQTAATNMTASVNTFRYVLNKYVGYDLPLLSDCNYTAGSKYYLFDYTLVSGKLKDATDPPACSR